MKDKYKYVIDGVSYPRITNILNIINFPVYRMIRNKYGDMIMDSIMQERAGFGIELHKHCRYYALTMEMPKGIKDKEMIECMKKYIQWFDVMVKDVIGTEMRVVSKKYQYAGTLDLIFRSKDNKVIVVDYKSGASSILSLWQSAAYLKAYEEMTGEKVDKCGVLPFNTKNLKLHYGKKNDDFRYFLYCKELYNKICA